jgi:hypothetical protein
MPDQYYTQRQPWVLHERLMLAFSFAPPLDGREKVKGRGKWYNSQRPWVTALSAISANHS